MEAISLDSIDVVELHVQLVDRSLIAYDEETGRFRLLDTVRQYALDRLRQEGDESRFRRSHRDHFLRFVEASRPLLRGPSGGERLAMLEADHENLRAAIEWCLAEPEATEAGLRMAGCLQHYWSVRGYLREGLQTAAAVLALPDAAAWPEQRADVLNAAGNLAHAKGDDEAARTFHEEALAIRSALGPHYRVTGSMLNLGNVCRALGEDVRARELFEQCLAHPASREGTAYLAACMSLGEMEYYAGELAWARMHYELALREAEAKRDEQAAAYAVSNLGNVARREGELETAHRLRGESLRRLLAVGDQPGVVECLKDDALLATAERHFEAALTLFAADAAQRERLGIRMPTPDQEVVRVAIANCRDALGTADAMAAWSRGAALTFGCAAALAAAQHTK